MYETWKLCPGWILGKIGNYYGLGARQVVPSDRDGVYEVVNRNAIANIIESYPHIDRDEK